MPCSRTYREPRGYCRRNPPRDRAEQLVLDGFRERWLLVGWRELDRDEQDDIGRTGLRGPSGPFRAASVTRHVVDPSPPFHEDSAQDLLEYALLASFIGLVCAAGVLEPRICHHQHRVPEP